MADAYGEDLASIHDAGFGGLAAAAAPVLRDALRRRGLASGRVVDLGCGSGILAGAMAATGYDVLGIDVSAAMVALASARVPGGHFREGPLLDVDLPRCVAVAAVGEVVNYQFDPRGTPAVLRRLFVRIHGALAPGGVFLLDVAEPGRVPGPGPYRTHAEGDGWAVLVTAEEDRRRGWLTRRITTFYRVGEVYRRGEEVHRLRLLRRSELAEQLRAIGFRVRLLAGYGPLRFGPGHGGLLARKP